MGTKEYRQKDRARRSQEKVLVVALNPDWVKLLADLFSPCLGFFFFLNIYLFLAALGLSCYTSAFYSLVAGHGLLIVVASLVAEHGL